jgi:ArsR family transcriptional regulator
MPRQKKELSDTALEMIAERFRILAEPMRLKILHTLWEDELTVTQIVERTGGLQANISKHLGLLQQVGVVSRRKEGLNVYYRISDDTVFDLCEVVCNTLHDRLVGQIDALTEPLPRRKRA